MERIPVEIWCMILGNLMEWEDCINASEASLFWGKVLKSMERKWMFGMVLPFLLKYLKKEDVLACRLVCEHWCYAVTNFMENNPCHRPPRESANQIESSAFHDEVAKMVTLKGLKFHPFSEKRIGRMKMISAAGNHSRNPILGRSVSFDQVWTHDEIMGTGEIVGTDLTYFQSFGSHIWFLNVSSVDCFPSDDDDNILTPVDFVKRAVDLLCFFPNLKKFELSYGDRECLDIKLYEKDLRKYLKSELSSGKRDKLPKHLESLKLPARSDWYFKHGRVNDTLLKLLVNPDLKSLSTDNVASVPSIKLAANLVEVSFGGGFSVTRKDLKRLTKTARNLSRLSIHLENENDIPALSNILPKFQESLTQLELVINDNYNLPWSFEEFKKFEQGVVKSNKNLRKLKNLKRLKLILHVPLPLKFLNGLSSVLEYLDVSAFLDESQLYYAANLRLGTGDDRVRMSFWPNIDQMTVYQANVFSTFPKLRVLSVTCVEGGVVKDSKFRRDEYEKRMEIGGAN